MQPTLMLLCFPLLAGWVTMGLAPLDKVLNNISEFRLYLVLIVILNIKLRTEIVISNIMFARISDLWQIYVFYIARVLQGLGVMSSVTQVNNPLTFLFEIQV